MRNKVKSIMLIDDNPDDNFVHERLIKKNNAADNVIVKINAREALAYLQSKEAATECSPSPDLIFLDINMPGMNGWEFLEAYAKLGMHIQRQTIVVMLTTSENPDDMMQGKLYKEIAEFQTKPLTQLMLEEILEKHFQDSASHRSALSPSV